MENKKLISTTEALEIASNEFEVNVTLPTMISWCKRFGIGAQLYPKGAFRINPDKLRTLLRG